MKNKESTLFVFLNRRMQNLTRRLHFIPLPPVDDYDRRLMEAEQFSGITELQA